jgi:hypothetical protein
MAASVRIEEPDGMSLVLSPSPGRPSVLVARLVGTDFAASVTVDSDPAFPELGSVSDFLVAAADMQAGQWRQWTALGEDLDLRAEVDEGGRVSLVVHFGSTSDDACCWQASARLCLDRAELRRAGAEAAPLFEGPA